MFKSNERFTSWEWIKTTLQLGSTWRGGASVHGFQFKFSYFFILYINYTAYTDFSF